MNLVKKFYGLFVKNSKRNFKNSVRKGQNYRNLTKTKQNKKGPNLVKGV